MTQTAAETLLTILFIALATLFLRALPFLLFPPSRETPEYIRYLGFGLPYAVIGMLVVYCLKGVSPTAAPFGLPELISILCIFILHKLKHNTLLSIGGGTALYMLLIRLL